MTQYHFTTVVLAALATLQETHDKTINFTLDQWEQKFNKLLKQACEQEKRAHGKN